jgi:hypothetical protein
LSSAPASLLGCRLLLLPLLDERLCVDEDLLACRDDEVDLLFDEGLLDE